jgi:hypothetical protein
MTLLERGVPLPLKHPHACMASYTGASYNVHGQIVGVNVMDCFELM